jgi:cellulose synthase/poly-beta-1,6-N-acetylglucosamine synthase-like glycosyltransferase
MKTKLPRILIGCPTYSGKEYCIERYIDRVKNLTYKNYDILLIDNSKGNKFFNKIKKLKVPVIKGTWNEQSKIRLTNSQNKLREICLKKGYEYMMMLESDLIPPKDIIEQLLSHKKLVVSGWYYITSTPRPCLSQTWELVDMKFKPKIPLLTEMSKQRLMKVFMGSFGCSLIHRSVLEQIKFKVFKTFSHHADTWFYFDCEKLNIPVFVDTDLLVPHFQDYQWDKILNKDKLIETESMRLKLEKLE